MDVSDGLANVTVTIIAQARSLCALISIIRAPIMADGFWLVLAGHLIASPSHPDRAALISGQPAMERRWRHVDELVEFFSNGTMVFICHCLAILPRPAARIEGHSAARCLASSDSHPAVSVVTIGEGIMRAEC